MSRTTSDRLAVKTLDQRFRYELETGFEMAPRTAQGVLEAARSAFSLDAVTGRQNGRLRPGQIRQVIAAAGASHGRPLRETEMVEVIWTIKAGEEDQEVLKEQGAQALRLVRILRLVDEALAQGGGNCSASYPRVERPMGTKRDVVKKGGEGSIKPSGFLRASSTRRKLDCLNPRIERDLWYRVGTMVTPTLPWIEGRMVATLYLRPRDAS